MRNVGRVICPVTGPTAPREEGCLFQSGVSRTTGLPEAKLPGKDRAGPSQLLDLPALHFKWLLGGQQLSPPSGISGTKSSGGGRARWLIVPGPEQQLWVTRGSSDFRPLPAALQRQARPYGT